MEPAASGQKLKEIQSFFETGVNSGLNIVRTLKPSCQPIPTPMLVENECSAPA
jgi:hypothetical protein